MNLNDQLSNYVLGIIDYKSIPQIGISAFNEGIESENMIIIAGMSNNDNSFELTEYFKKALKENNITLPEKKEACQTLCSKFALSIIGKEIEPYDGCKEIEKLIGRTTFNWEDLGLYDVYCNYIGLWETYGEGWKFNTNIEKQNFIKKANLEIVDDLIKWRNTL